MKLDLIQSEARLVYELVTAHYNQLVGPYAVTRQQQTPPPMPDKVRKQAEAIWKGILQPLDQYLGSIPRGY